MKAEFLTIYEAIGHNDSDWGGPSYSFTVGHSFSHSGALKKAEGRGGWGSNGDAKPIKAVRIDGKIYQIIGPLDVDDQNQIAQEQLKQAALSKLSPDERAALGLK